MYGADSDYYSAPGDTAFAFAEWDLEILEPRALKEARMAATPQYSDEMVKAMKERPSMLVGGSVTKWFVHPRDGGQYYHGIITKRYPNPPNKYGVLYHVEFSGYQVRKSWKKQTLDQLIKAGVTLPPVRELCCATTGQEVRCWVRDVAKEGGQRRGRTGGAAALTGFMHDNVMRQLYGNMQSNNGKGRNGGTNSGNKKKREKAMGKITSSSSWKSSSSMRAAYSIFGLAHPGNGHRVNDECPSVENWVTGKVEEHDLFTGASFDGMEGEFYRSPARIPGVFGCACWLNRECGTAAAAGATLCGTSSGESVPGETGETGGAGGMGAAAKINGSDRREEWERKEWDHLTLSPMEEPAKMKVVDLRASLERRGLDTSGLKKVLQERLTAALAEEAESASSAQEGAAGKSGITYCQRLKKKKKKKKKNRQYTAEQEEAYRKKKNLRHGRRGRSKKQKSVNSAAFDEEETKETTAESASSAEDEEAEESANSVEEGAAVESQRWVGPEQQGKVPVVPMAVGEQGAAVEKATPEAHGCLPQCTKCGTAMFGFYHRGAALCEQCSFYHGVPGEEDMCPMAEVATESDCAARLSSSHPEGLVCVGCGFDGDGAAPFEPDVATVRFFWKSEGRLRCIPCRAQHKLLEHLDSFARCQGCSKPIWVYEGTYKGKDKRPRIADWQFFFENNHFNPPRSCVACRQARKTNGGGGAGKVPHWTEDELAGTPSNKSGNNGGDGGGWDGGGGGSGGGGGGSGSWGGGDGGSWGDGGGGGGGTRLCRYDGHCTRPGCTFVHSGTPDGSNRVGPVSSSTGGYCVYCRGNAHEGACPRGAGAQGGGGGSGSWEGGGVSAGGWGGARKQGYFAQTAGACAQCGKTSCVCGAFGVPPPAIRWGSLLP